jgi:C-terminal processing protease CtpA/Prc
LLTLPQMQHDLAVLHATVRAGHPAVGRYRPVAYLDSCAAATRALLTGPLTARQFRAVLRPYVAAIGCGHTSIQPATAALKAAKGQAPFVLPLRFFADSSRLFVAAAPGVAPEKIRPGEEIISLDQRPAPVIVRDLLVAVPSDGFNQTHRRYALQHHGAVYYALTYGLPETHDLTLRDPATGQLRTVALGRADVDTAAGRLAERRLRPLPVPGEQVVRQAPFGRLSVLPGAPAVGVLTLTTLTGRQKAFYRAAFAEIRQRNLRHLVLDLRGNGGGGVFTSNTLLRYLLPHPYRFVFETTLAQRRIRRRLHMDFWERTTPALLSFTPDQRWFHGRHQFRTRYRPRRQRFAGQLLVLTDGGTFSMGSYVAAYLQQLGGATVVGEETGGGAAGSNAMLEGQLVLPESRQRLRFPVYRIVHQTPPADTGRGVMPDVPVAPTLADLLQQRDPVLEAARSLVK